jgi:hypothetical protein
MMLAGMMQFYTWSANFSTTEGIMEEESIGANQMRGLLSEQLSETCVVFYRESSFDASWLTPAPRLGPRVEMHEY